MDEISNALQIIREKLPKLETRLDEPLCNHTSFKIGGPVRAMLFPENTAMMRDLYEILKKNGIAALVLGNGTNLLVRDEPLDMLVINTTRLGGIEPFGDSGLRADAGVPLSKLAVFACESGLSGLEFAHGIPGTLGGAVNMNAGAYGAEMAGVVYSTTVIGDKTGELTITGEEQRFSYRHSRFSQLGEIILSSELHLQKADSASIREKMEELNKRRRESQPLELHSAGSIFKRPKTGYAAEMIEQAGLKGYTTGGAQVSEKHSGFIVNTGTATYSDVMAVIDHVRKTVEKQFGVELELEVKII